MRGLRMPVTAIPSATIPESQTAIVASSIPPSISGRFHTTTITSKEIEKTSSSKSLEFLLKS